MTHNEKIELAISELKALGVSKGAIAPPAFQLAWKLGVEIPPPHFLSFGALTMSLGSFFGALWGIFYVVHPLESSGLHR